MKLIDRFRLQKWTPPTGEYVLDYRSDDGLTEIEDMNGVSWTKAELPPTHHRCYPQTRAWMNFERVFRCACEDGERIELLSIGVVCDDGREFYAVSYDADHSHANEWVAANVLPHLGTPVAHRGTIAGDLLKFVNQGVSKPEFWAYYGDYDWVVLCQLYGTMMDLPKSWPMFAMDVKQLCVSLGDPRLPEQTSIEHNALEDARWTRDAYLWLVEECAG